MSQLQNKRSANVASGSSGASSVPSFQFVKSYVDDCAEVESKRFKAAEEEAVMFSYFELNEKGEKFFAPRCPIRNCKKPIELVGKGKGHFAGVYGCPDDFIDIERGVMGPCPHSGILFMWDRMKTVQAFKPGNDTGSFFIPRDCQRHMLRIEDEYPLQQRFSTVFPEGSNNELQEKIKAVCDWGDHRNWDREDKEKFEKRVAYYYSLCDIVNRVEKIKYANSAKANAAERNAGRKKQGKFFNKVTFDQNTTTKGIFRSQMNANMIVDVCLNEGPFTMRMHCSCPKSLCSFYAQLPTYPGNEKRLYKAVASVGDKFGEEKLDLTDPAVRENVIPYHIIKGNGYHLEDGPSGKRMFKAELNAALAMASGGLDFSESGSSESGNLMGMPVGAYNAGLSSSVLPQELSFNVGEIPD